MAGNARRRTPPRANPIERGDPGGPGGPPAPVGSPVSVRGIVAAVLASVATLLVLLLVFGWLAQQSSGKHIYGGQKLDGLADEVKLVLDSYGDLTRLVTTAFGALAFLVTYQQKRRALVSTRAWALLAAGIAFLLGALVLSLLGGETVLSMVGRNAVDLGLPALAFARWATYACLVAAAAFLGFFALDVAVAPAPAPAPAAAAANDD